MDWDKEAKLIAKNIEQFVKSVKVSTTGDDEEGDFQNKAHLKTFLNLETLEGDKFHVLINESGFTIQPPTSNTVDFDSKQQRLTYETIYALLDDNSVEYRKAFANALINKLQSC